MDHGNAFQAMGTAAILAGCLCFASRQWLWAGMLWGGVAFAIFCPGWLAADLAMIGAGAFVLVILGSLLGEPGAIAVTPQRDAADHPRTGDWRAHKTAKAEAEAKLAATIIRRNRKRTRFGQ
jgi:hypothetical protein